jgi:hypothetical protein
MISPILSLSPVDALSYLAGFDSQLEVRLVGKFDLPATVIVHSLGYPDNGTDALLTQEIMTEFGFCTDTFPAYALQGTATIVPLGAMRNNWMPLQIANGFFFDEPIYDVLPLPEVGVNCLWLPQTSAQVTASLWAHSLALE